MLFGGVMIWKGGRRKEFVKRVFTEKDINEESLQAKEIRNTVAF